MDFHGFPWAVVLSSDCLQIMIDSRIFIDVGRFEILYYFGLHCKSELIHKSLIEDFACGHGKAPFVRTRVGGIRIRTVDASNNLFLLRDSRRGHSRHRSLEAL